MRNAIMHIRPATPLGLCYAIPVAPRPPTPVAAPSPPLPAWVPLRWVRDITVGECGKDGQANQLKKVAKEGHLVHYGHGGTNRNLSNDHACQDGDDGRLLCIGRGLPGGLRDRLKHLLVFLSKANPGDPQHLPSRCPLPWSGPPGPERRHHLPRHGQLPHGEHLQK